MAFEFSCPQCKHTMQMDNSAAGEMGVCPACSVEVLIQRGAVEVETEKNQTQQEELSQTIFASDPSGAVELGAGRTLITRLVMVLVLLGIISGGGYLIYNKALEIWEDEAPTGLSEYQKELLRQTSENKGRPDYSEYAVEQPERTEEEKKKDAEMGASGGGFGGAPAGGGQRGGGDTEGPELQNGQPQVDN